MIREYRLLGGAAERKRKVNLWLHSQEHQESREEAEVVI